MKKILFWLICLSILRGLAYLVVTPPWQAPDETTHFQFVELLTQRPLREIRNIELRKADDPYLQLEQQILSSMKRHRAWEYVGVPTPDPLPRGFWETPFFVGSAPKIYRPPLYYLIGAGVLKLFHVEGIERRMYVLRLYSLILFLGTIVLSCLIGYLVFKDRAHALMTGASVSFLPQAMVVGTSVNSDNLVNLLGAAFLLFALFLLDRKKRGGYLLLIPFFLFLLFMSGKTGLILVPVGIFLLGFQLFHGKSKRFLWLLAVLLLGLASAGIFLGHPLPGTILERLFISGEELGPSGQKSPAESGFYWSFGVLLFQSFWFAGGWMSVYWNRWIYAGLGALTLFSISGLFLIMPERWREKDKSASPSNPVLLTMAVSALTALLGSLFYYGWVKEVFAQGRYLFPVLPAFGILFITGLEKIGPRSILSRFPIVFIVLMASIDLYSLFGCLLPYFHLR